MHMGTKQLPNMAALSRWTDTHTETHTHTSFIRQTQQYSGLDIEQELLSSSKFLTQILTEF